MIILVKILKDADEKESLGVPEMIEFTVAQEAKDYIDSEIAKGVPEGESIVDWMKANEQDSSYENRAKLAEEKGIENYVGSTEQNIQLLDILKKEAEDE